MLSRSRRLLALAALFGVALTLGSGHVCARLAFRNGADLLSAAAVRALFAAVFLFVLLRLRGIPIVPLRASPRPVFMLGLLICVQTLSVQAAVARLPVTLAILLFYTYPFFTGVVSSALGTERLGAHALAALVLAFGGLTLVLGVHTADIDVLGVLAAVSASAAFTAVLVATPRVAPGFAAPLRTFIMMATAAAVFGAALAVTGGFHWPDSVAGQLGLLGLGGFYAVGISVLFLVLPLLGATQTAVVLNLEPVMVALIAWAALGEALGALQVLGASMVVSAVIYFQVAGRAKA